MTTTKKTYLDWETEILPLLIFAKAQKGITVNIEQKRFVKIVGQAGKKIYISKHLKVGRVDVSGFEVQEEGFRAPACGHFGRVWQQLDFARKHDAVYTTFRMLLEVLCSSEPENDDTKDDRKSLIAERARRFAQEMEDLVIPTAAEMFDMPSYAQA